MSLNKQIKRAIELFLNHPRVPGQNVIKISDQLLKENGLDNSNFWEVICPMLEKDASLKYSRVFEVENTNQIRASEMRSRLEANKNKQNKLYSRRDRGPVPFNEDEKNYLNQQENKLNEKLASISTTFYTFEIDPEKLDEVGNKYTKHQQLYNIEIKIVWNSENSTLIINSKEILFPKETLESVLLDVLVDKKTEVSWDEILDMYDENGANSEGQNPKRKKEVGDARDRINRKVKKTDLKEDLISRRKNVYALKRKVTKGD